METIIMIMAHVGEAGEVKNYGKGCNILREKFGATSPNFARFFFILR